MLKTLGKNIINFNGWGVLLLSLLLFHAPLQSQDIEGTFKLAQHYYQTGNYHASVKTYQRLLYFTADTLQGRLHQNLAHCYLKVQDYHKARHHYEQAYFDYSQDSLKHIVLLDKIYATLLSKNFKMALIDYYNLPDTLPDRMERQKKYYGGIIHFGMEEFDKSKNKFKSVLPDTAESRRQQIDKYFAKIDDINQLNPQTAKILSMIIPGLGQFYVGDIKEGLNSLLLTSGIIALGVYTAVNITLLDALISVSPWYGRYYYGGIKNAEEIAQQTIVKKRSQVYQRILEIIPPPEQ